MDPIGDDLLRIMEPELGYREGPGQHSKFGEWYSLTVDQDPQYKTAPWCDMFIAWAAERADVEEFVGQFAWTPSHARWFETQGAWSQTPEAGSLIFFDWSGGKDIKGIDHVGVVERVEGGTIHTIEGNVDGVWLKRKARDESKVVGYGSPRKVKENLAGVTAGQDASVLQAAGRIEVRPALVPGSMILTDYPGRFPISLEAAPVAALLTLILGMTFVLVRARPHTSTGRHRRKRRRREPYRLD
ncbi:CHAP domain-containing protein [Streptosporangium lutulentum]|uniref:Peptidase C51 domain-containing protein n=1 Tax=Streptosporangium lutulentum TaxID=1461250 RepID=A0ABT9QAL4_9ACTN|nr:CHAP domain-containing protein [Streptosporangium lutulentum]MDP9843806.1 hypothetical protein [Streptosporangium lutulentum]